MDNKYASIQIANTEFAEIEYEFDANMAATSEKERQSSKPAAQAQPVAIRTVDSIQEKFFQMRSLASGNPFHRKDAELFYKQAKFMEDFTDEYHGTEPFFTYFPYYQLMGHEQLRTYFTWRTKVRSGEIRPVSLSYLYLYIYELLSGVGVSDPADGLGKLMAVWNTVREYSPAMDSYMPQWLKDYHIYYELPHSFKDFVQSNSLQKCYQELFLFDSDAENSLELWNSLSYYDVTRSKFFNMGNETLFQDCFYAVLRGIKKLFASHNMLFEDLLIYGVHRDMPWSPFQRALFYPWLWQPDRRVEMPGRKIYYCKNNQWTADMPMQYSGKREFASYIVKKTEERLRRQVEFKYKITADPSVMSWFSGKMEKKNISQTELDAAIEKSVADFHRDLTRTVVAVDHDNLKKIRKEALGTQGILTVPEEEALPMSAATPQNAAEFPEQPAKCQQLGGWPALRDALSEAERRALSSALLGMVDLKAFADESGVMLEVLADGINEKAIDLIGDNILDDNMAVYIEYIEKVKEMAG